MSFDRSGLPVFRLDPDSGQDQEEEEQQPHQGQVDDDDDADQPDHTPLGPFYRFGHTAPPRAQSHDQVRQANELIASQNQSRIEAQRISLQRAEAYRIAAQASARVRARDMLAAWGRANPHATPFQRRIAHRFIQRRGRMPPRLSLRLIRAQRKAPAPPLPASLADAHHFQAADTSPQSAQGPSRRVRRHRPTPSDVIQPPHSATPMRIAIPFSPNDQHTSPAYTAASFLPVHNASGSPQGYTATQDQPSDRSDQTQDPYEIDVERAAVRVVRARSDSYVPPTATSPSLRHTAEVAPEEQDDLSQSRQERPIYYSQLERVQYEAEMLRRMERWPQPAPRRGQNDGRQVPPTPRLGQNRPSPPPAPEARQYTWHHFFPL
jgi:hypothetical protein